VCESMGLEQAQGRNESKGRRTPAVSGSPQFFCGAHRRPAPFHSWMRRSPSTHVVTRKMVTYARTG
jgi:hypothetical protein